ncbi:MAG: hypothetical protein RLZ69_846 [Actinomycetota bacterium]
MFEFSGFRDGHCHPLFAERESAGPNISGAKSQSEVVALIRDYLASHPNADWIDCGSYEPDLYADQPLNAATLDEASAGVPIVVHAADHHSIWVNTAALRVAGLTETVPVVSGGSIDIDAYGYPTGVLREWNAMSLIYAHQPSPNLESDLNAYSRAQERLLAAGVVAVQEAWIDRGMPEVYIEASRRGLLKLRVNLAVRISAEAWQEDLRFAKATRSAIRDVADPLLTANTVKVFVDGVFGSGTALSQSPYYDGHAAEPVWQIDELRRMALAADNAGFQLHFHAIGDQAVSIAVDTVEHLELCNGWVDRRPVIAHAELVSAADLTRIRRLGIVVCQQPIWATEGASVQQVRDLLGDSVAEQLYPIRTLLDAGIRVSFGSDWPVSDPEPLPGLYAAATRVQPSSLLPPLNASEAIPLPQALRSYSDEVAYQLGQDPMADRVILDTDLTTCSPAELLAANVVSVTIANKLVWQAN